MQGSLILEVENDQKWCADSQEQVCVLLLGVSAIALVIFSPSLAVWNLSSNLLAPSSIPWIKKCNNDNKSQTEKKKTWEVSLLELFVKQELKRSEWVWGDFQRAQDMTFGTWTLVLHWLLGAYSTSVFLIASWFQDWWDISAGVSYDGNLVASLWGRDGASIASRGDREGNSVRMAFHAAGTSGPC